MPIFLVAMNYDDTPRSRKTPFLQPLRKSRFGFDVELEPGEEEWLRRCLSNEAQTTQGELKMVPPLVATPLSEFENLIADDRVENAAVWSTDGVLRDRRRSQKAAEVTVNESALPGGILTHNHPAQNPPSFRDINNLIAFGMAELRVVTGRFLYRVQAGPRASKDLLIEKVPGVARWLNASDHMALSMMYTMHWNTEQAEAAALHSLLAWLAAQDIILYERTPRP